jgi:hypothetical protein
MDTRTYRTKQQWELIFKEYENLGLKGIAETLGCDSYTVSSAAKRYNLSYADKEKRKPLKSALAHKAYSSAKYDRILLKQYEEKLQKITESHLAAIQEATKEYERKLQKH